MPSYKEFEAQCNRMDQEITAEQARQNSFVKSLETAWIEIAFQFFQETEPHKHHFIDRLTRETHDMVLEINDILDFMLYSTPADESKDPSEFNIPERDVSEVEKKYLEDTLAKMPPEQHEYFIQLNYERVKAEDEERRFEFKCHDKAKELIVKYFLEIVDFSANSIRRINHSTYYTITDFVEGFYYMASDYLNEEYP